MSRSEIERLLDDLRVRFALKGRAIKVLRVMLAEGDDLWRFAGSEPEIAASAGVSVETVSRGVRELEQSGVVTGHFENGKTKQYRVREDVISGEVTIPDALRQQRLEKPRYRVSFTEDGPVMRRVDPGHRDLLTPVSDDGDPGQPEQVTPVKPEVDPGQPSNSDPGQNDVKTSTNTGSNADRPADSDRGQPPIDHSSIDNSPIGDGLEESGGEWVFFPPNAGFERPRWPSDIQRRHLQNPAAVDELFRIAIGLPGHVTDSDIDRLRFHAVAANRLRRAKDFGKLFTWAIKQWQDPENAGFAEIAKFIAAQDDDAAKAAIASLPAARSPPTEAALAVAAGVGCPQDIPADRQDAIDELERFRNSRGT